MMSNPKEIPMGQYAEPNRQEEAEMQHFSYEIFSLKIGIMHNLLFHHIFWGDIP